MSRAQIRPAYVAFAPFTPGGGVRAQLFFDEKRGEPAAIPAHGDPENEPRGRAARGAGEGIMSTGASDQ